jgi:gliding motility-associated-like protein
VQVTVNLIPQTPVIAGKSLFCQGNNAIVSVANLIANTTYVWSNGATGNSITVNTAGNFSVKAVNNASGCESATSNIWSVSEYAPTFPSDTMLMKGESISLIASGGSIYLWTPAIGLSANNIANPVANPTQTTTYKLTISNGQGCAETRNVTVNVVEIFVPNMFSPNGNNQNDVLKVYGNDLAEYELLLFNRLGNEVGRIDQTAAFSSWNGEYQGKTLAGETLVWTLRGKTSNGTPFTKKGSVIVMK